MDNEMTYAHKAGKLSAEVEYLKLRVKQLDGKLDAAMGALEEANYHQCVACEAWVAFARLDHSDRCPGCHGITVREEHEARAEDAEVARREALRYEHR